MGFFDSVKNEENLGVFEGASGFDLIPKDTQLLASAEEIKWDSYEGVNFINIKWRAMAPEAYKNRLVFQKIKLEDQKEDVAKKALRMLAAIDANAGGKLIAAGVRPTNEMLASSLMHKPMVIKIGVWEIKEENKTGNYIMAVAPRNANAAPAAPAAQARPATPPPSFMGGFDDDIPFN
jgi:hypothetical protein